MLLFFCLTSCFLQTYPEGPGAPQAQYVALWPIWVYIGVRETFTGYFVPGRFEMVLAIGLEDCHGDIEDPAVYQ